MEIERERERLTLAVKIFAVYQYIRFYQYIGQSHPGLGCNPSWILGRATSSIFFLCCFPWRILYSIFHLHTLLSVRKPFLFSGGTWVRLPATEPKKPLLGACCRRRAVACLVAVLNLVMWLWMGRCRRCRRCRLLSVPGPSESNVKQLWQPLPVSCSV